MRLIKSTIPNFRRSKRTMNRKILEDFIESGEQCCEVVDYETALPYTTTTSLNQSIKRYRIGGIKAVTVNKRVYLIKLI